jgi:quercetin dioxygenase-like cupin family protein
MSDSARIVRNGEGTQGLDCVFKATGDDSNGHFDLMVATVGYRSGPPLHTHETQDDSFFVLEGVLAVQAGDDVFDLQPGDFVQVPPGVPHTFDNLRSDQPPVRAINLMTPGGFDHFMEDLARTDVAAMTDEVQDEMLRTHGVSWVGPPLHEKVDDAGQG